MPQPLVALPGLLLLVGDAGVREALPGERAAAEPRVVLYGAGLGLGASSLMLITIRGVGPADAGAVSGVVNTVVQLGMAAGPAAVGTVFFGRLAAHGYVDAMRSSLFAGLALFAVALLACLLLPRRQAPRMPDAASTDIPVASGDRG